MFENIIGTQVNITIDRPLGSSHPKLSDLIYPVNYGYVEGIIAVIHKKMMWRING